MYIYSDLKWLFLIFIGTETDFFAGYRACQCLEGLYRTDMFDKCYKCGQGGLECKDGYASLKSVYPAVHTAQSGPSYPFLHGESKPPLQDSSTGHL